jgi:hypothetical protein
MTALQAAKAECANCDGAGNCAAVSIADDLSCYMFRTPGKCYLAEQSIKRCVYFEQYVAPAANERLRNAATAEQRIRAKSLAAGVREYEMAVLPAPVSAKFRCASAGCRRTVLRPARFCPKHGENGSRTAENANFAHSR